jgi:hypothetical protein
MFAISVFLINKTSLTWPLKIGLMALSFFEVFAFSMCFEWLDELENEIQGKRLI